jgi:hypothetical protein
VSAQFFYQMVNETIREDHRHPKQMAKEIPGNRLGSSEPGFLDRLTEGESGK